MQGFPSPSFPLPSLRLPFLLTTTPVMQGALRK